MLFEVGERHVLSGGTLPILTSSVLPAPPGAHDVKRDVLTWSGLDLRGVNQVTSGVLTLRPRHEAI